LKTKLRSIRALLLGKAPEFHTAAPSSAAPQSTTSTQ
jgi:hypothetical protein